MNDLKLGELITTPRERDAIHVAVAPVVAGETLNPGDHVGIDKDGKARLFWTCDPSRTMAPTVEAPIGVVDPFLTKSVPMGATFWLCLYPGSITSLRHDWTHPAFSEPIADKEESRKWMEQFAAQHYSDKDEWYSGLGRHYTADEIIEYAKDFLLTGERHVQQGSESLRNTTNAPEFWRHFELLTGMKVADYHIGQVPFSCSC